MVPKLRAVRLTAKLFWLMTANKKGLLWLNNIIFVIVPVYTVNKYAGR
jgi:hypothetical protein